VRETIMADHREVRARVAASLRPPDLAPDAPAEPQLSFTVPPAGPAAA
jgi:hypothetical protein